MNSISVRSWLSGISAVLVALALTACGVVAASFIWTEYAWYASMGRSSVFAIRLVSQGGILLVGTAISFGVLFAAASAARRIVDGPKIVARIVVWGSVILALGVSWDLAQHWMQLRLAITGPAFGMNDPLFGRDIGFFIFTLPALEVIARWVSDVLVLAIVFVLGIVFIPTLFDVGGTMEGKWWRFKTLASVLAGLVMLSAAFTFYVSVWQLALSTRTQYFGAGYTDTHAQLPSTLVLLGVTVVVAIILLATAKSQRWRLPVAAFGVWVAVAALLTAAWPALVQTYVVKPNEATLELPYIERNIEMTREGFDLTSVKGVQYPITPQVVPRKAAAASESLANARIWTPLSAQPAFDQLQTIRPYYRLSAIDTDRYQVAGASKQTLVAARQVDASGLPKPARTWVNEHLVYTHGYGVAISSANDATAQGFPHFMVGDVPPATDESLSSADDLSIDEARVYFGPDMTEYAIVDTNLEEFDYPADETNATSRYEGAGGVGFGNLLGRIAWAIRFGTGDVLFSGYLTPESRVLMYRSINERAEKIAPWLGYEKTPYAAIVDGRIVWILDAYTTSRHFPYSQPLADDTNYLRNSVKVVVDAATGETRFYAMGEDPVRDAWMAIYPGVISPSSDVPASLAAHFRAPTLSFNAQAKVYRTYHMTDPTVFYNKEDQWSIPSGKDGKASYLMLDLPDSQPGPNLYLMQPYTPADRDNLIGWMATACDPADYGKRTVFLLPKDRVILGPEQVRARINQDPRISPQLSLWDQRGSEVIFGQMLVLPSQNTVTYIQPIFLQAQKSAITELASVVVMNGDRIEMGPTLNAAVDMVFATESAHSTGTALIDTLMDKAAQEKARGDLATYKETLRRLGAAIAELQTTEDGASQ